MTLTFRVDQAGQPQGSSSGFSPLNSRRVTITSANKRLKPFRAEVTRCARVALFLAGYDGDDGPSSPMFVKHTPVRAVLEFTFQRPKSVRNRPQHVVKPDLDKLARGVFDALTGVLWNDDAQCVELVARKQYGDADSVLITVENKDNMLTADGVSETESSK